MKLLKLIFASLAFGLIARPLLLTEEGTKLAVVSIFIIIVVSAVRETERNEEKVAPWARKLVRPLRNKKVYFAIQAYAFGWVFARTTVAEAIAELFR